MTSRSMNGGFTLFMTTLHSIVLQFGFGCFYYASIKFERPGFERTTKVDSTFHSLFTPIFIKNCLLIINCSLLTLTKLTIIIVINRFVIIVNFLNHFGLNGNFPVSQGLTYDYF